MVAGAKRAEASRPLRLASSTQLSMSERPVDAVSVHTFSSSVALLQMSPISRAIASRAS